MAKQILLSCGFTDSAYKTPYWLYPKTFAPTLGFGVYQTIWADDYPDGSGMNMVQYHSQLEQLPKRSLLMVNREGLTWWPYDANYIDRPNYEAIDRRIDLLNYTRTWRTDIRVGLFDGTPYSQQYAFVGTSACPKVVQVANENTYDLGNAAHVLFPSLYVSSKSNPPDDALWVKEFFRVSRLTYPDAEIIPLITVMYMDRLAEVFAKYPGQNPASSLDFRWTQADLDYCWIPILRLKALLSQFTRAGVKRIAIWSEGMVPVDAANPQMIELKNWQNS